MATDIRVPALGESVTEATIGQWFKKVGDRVEADEPLVELETDKVTLEVPAPSSGVIESIEVKDGATVNVGAVLGRIGEASGAAAKPAAGARPAAKDAAKDAAVAKETPAAKKSEPAPAAKPAAANLAPSVNRIITENRLEPAQITGTGKDGRLTKGDVLAAVDTMGKAPAAAAAPVTARAPSPAEDGDKEERVRMTRLRQTIARRLKDAQNTAAMLTTFNEVDMSAVMDLRTRYKEIFEQKHGFKLGFMGIFAKAVIHALKEIPAVNAEIDGEDIVYKNYYHIGIAVGLDKGLVVPVVRDADKKSLSDIEKEIGELGRRARDGKLTIQEMQGGTFTMSNGGVYGSLMSTPILNAPQSGILGMHKILERPVAIDGKVEIRPMMYLALTYDHRIVDGREAVTFLVRVKDVIEAPERLVFDL